MPYVLLDGCWFCTCNVPDEVNREALAIEAYTHLPALRVIRVIDPIVMWCGWLPRHSSGGQRPRVRLSGAG